MPRFTDGLRKIPENRNEAVEGGSFPQISQIGSDYSERGMGGREA